MYETRHLIHIDTEKMEQQERGSVCVLVCEREKKKGLADHPVVVQDVMSELTERSGRDTMTTTLEGSRKKLSTQVSHHHKSDFRLSNGKWFYCSDTLKCNFNFK